MSYPGYSNQGYGGYPTVDRYSEPNRGKNYDRYETKSVDRLGDKRDRYYGRDAYSEKQYRSEKSQRSYPGYHSDNLAGLPPQTSPPVTSQPMSISKRKGAPKREWNTGLFECTDDMTVCCCVFCCTPFYECYKMEEFDEHCCNGWCLGATAFLLLRYRMRALENIEGSMVEDCLTGTCCYPCMVCQVIRENDILNKEEVKQSKSLAARMESRAAQSYNRY